MKKTSPKKLTLSRETLRQLDEGENAQAAGGVSRPVPTTCNCTQGCTQVNTCFCTQ
jgi:hypothetical protein